MMNTRQSIFRTALQVSPERIAALDDHSLSTLMRELLCAQAYRCGAPLNEVRVNTEGRAKDDGCDGWSPKPASVDEWLGSVDTCWQFKASSAGTPSRLTGEVTKPIPKKTLAAGGRFVVVASGSKSGKRGEDNRLNRLRQEARAAGLPVNAIDVLGSERLTSWCNLHPAKAAYWAGRPDGLCLLDSWLRSDEHRVPWQAGPSVQEEIEMKRRDLDFAGGSVQHLHIQGPPGVGKTRFALELCRSAPWRDAVIYVRQAFDPMLFELIDGATSEAGVRLMVVADEAQAEQLRPLRDSVERGLGRVRLITIGQCTTPDPLRIPALAVAPLGPDQMTAVIKGWYPAMPPEHVDFVVRFADGYIRLARLAADAVARNPSMSVRGLLDLTHIRSFLDGMLGAGDRLPLYVVAVLDRVGWIDDRESEGQAIAQHFSQNWNSVRAAVEDLHRRFGIVPRGGRYRYISPTPLGIHLAVEAWDTFPELLRTLPGVLPTDEARDSYYERLKSIVSNPQASQFARDELAFFFRIDDFTDERNARRWSALSAADPEMAARNILRALNEAEPEERKRIAGGARRDVVGALVRLAWKPAAFHDAVTALALLAEAENETWANNATGEFVARFQMFLGGTAMPYLDRLLVLDEQLAGREGLGSLIVKALAQVGNRHPFRMKGEPTSDELPEPEWRPATGQEYLACIEGAIERLRSIATQGRPELRTEILKAAKDLAMLLRDASVRDLVSDFFVAVRDAYPDAREELRRVIARVLHLEQRHGNKLPPEDVSALESIHASFEDGSLESRLRQYVGPASWDVDEQSDLRPLAKELLSDRSALEEQWPWLTSGQAADAWRLGEALASEDKAGLLEDLLPVLAGRGPDLRVLCAYVNTLRINRGTEWFSKWVTRQLARDPGDVALLFEVTWRCGATVETGRHLAEALRRQDVERVIVEQLAYGRWSEELPLESLADILEAMSKKGHGGIVLVIIERRLKKRPEEASAWDDLALKLVTSSEIIRSEHMASYFWQEVATRLVPKHSREIAAAIFHEQADRESGMWFVEHSEALKVLVKCVEHDPEGVWEELKPYLSSPDGAIMFSIGFPCGIVDLIPVAVIDAWVGENPEERAPILVRLASKDLSTDSTLISHLMGQFGDRKEVSSAFFSAYVSGSWSGPSSEHWSELAGGLEEVARRTKLFKLKRWAADAARSLREMARRDQQREEEENLRGY